MDTIYGEIWDVRLGAFQTVQGNSWTEAAIQSMIPSISLTRALDSIYIRILGGDSTFADAIQAAELLRKSDKVFDFTIALNLP
eukprot:763923-Hanusia_phi.AAC.2